MFSYRHAFHAGNHADVLKHTVLIATLDHLLEKDAALTVVDTHAGAGLYRLDGDYAGTSGEAAEGILRLLPGKKEPAAPTAAAAPAPAAKSAAKKAAPAAEAPLADAIARYLGVISDFNPKGGARVYPGSPFIIQHLLRDHDKLKLFELHPTDSRTLSANIAQLEAGRQIAVLLEDGFGSATKFLPPPSRRALVLMDPSYEMKTDYGRVLDFAAEALKRFATGTYAIWYPIIPRPEAHDLPRRLKTMATKAGKSWLHATLTVKSSKITKDAASGETQRPGLPASGMFLINPPYTLKPLLAEALPQLAERLGQDRNATFSLESGG
ncbi:competence protein ComJ [Variovorax paradoxus]|uniref:Ribosomal RNA large subunit methyltransferase J n=1 Tax=Variovorax paradoxus TaxID=34073 RepID=A0AA91DKI8_VARPD|nr:23S rRNA (adenine(2030)-N(6))-methyltransferase RlmJ [Variovorax paradoxus]OAK60719.1 competence protein ComJ [Variovorax paradoxus]